MNFPQEEMTLPQPKSAYFNLLLSLPVGGPCDGHCPVLVNIAILAKEFINISLPQLLKGKANQKFDVGVEMKSPLSHIIHYFHPNIGHIHL